jgi:hypothetical protein
MMFASQHAERDVMFKFNYSVPPYTLFTTDTFIPASLLVLLLSLFCVVLSIEVHLLSFSTSLHMKPHVAKEKGNMNVNGDKMQDVVMQKEE